MNAQFPIFQFKNPDATLPLELWTVPHPPEQLFIQGKPESLRLLKHLPDRGLAIVGTRNPQPRSQALLKTKLLELTRSELIIISGMARGIDSVAHHSALQAGLSTIAILGTGLDLAYPQETLGIRTEILKKGGLIITEFPPQTLGFQSNFLRRNRIIAGWSKATWVVEASFRSGALNTARWAREQNRDCFAVPGFPGDPALAGNQILLDQDHAHSFWGVHSLGVSWLDLAAHTPLKDPKRTAPTKRSSDSEILAGHVKKLTLTRGGTSIHHLLDWALSHPWDPERFFIALQENLKTGSIQDISGTFVSTESS
jgi:DNA protecting protein DprA